MKREEAKQTARLQFEQLTWGQKLGAYKAYATEELGFNSSKADKFATEIEKNPCATMFRQYQTKKAKDQFYTWYYITYCSQPFFNGFKQWLEVYNALLKDAHKHGPIPITGSIMKEITPEIAPTDLFDLAKKWANEFEFRFRDENWDKKNFHETLRNFCKEKRPPMFNNVLEYLRGNYTLVKKLHEGQQLRVESEEIEAAIKNNDLDICYTPSSLVLNNYRNDRGARSILMGIFLDRHKDSKFVQLFKHDADYQFIAISVVCDDKNIINDLIRLELCGTLL